MKGLLKIVAAGSVAATLLLAGCEDKHIERHYRENTVTSSDPQIIVTPDATPATPVPPSRK